MASQPKSVDKLDQLPDEAQNRIAQLRLLFVARCKENLIQIRQVLDDRAAANGPMTQDPSLIKLAHSLAGASAIFGYKDLGRTAFKLESTLREVNYPEADFTQAVEDLIEQLTALD
ncbi:Hpt domain-containing protein [Hoeflea sp. IMCC20628]|uniref:Hpt domain-containing protein n=1 Tax=Hoeflea sp. IMCC20628 TaxID=1620421 RepID=UPI00063A9AC8|nr:Hpt domain-containing protein [Hoeflea sp. IMCC20628]AKI02020.1 Hpt domain-containing protein [Hoeflea sp. IMCC20628]